MSIQGPGILVDGTGMPDDHGGWEDVEGMIPAALIPSLEMLHLFGSDFKTSYPEADAVLDYSIGDYSLNGRALTRFGSTPRGAKSFTSSGTDYYLSPLTGAQLMALGPDGSFTAFVVAKFQTAIPFCVAVGTWNTSVVDGWALGRAISTANRYQVSTQFLSLTDQSAPVIATDADTGTVYEFLAVVYDIPNLTITIYRQKPGAVIQTSSNALSGTFAPAQRICFGRSYPAPNFEGPVELVLGGCFSSAVSAANIQALQVSMKAFLAQAPYSITI